MFEIRPHQFFYIDPYKSATIFGTDTYLLATSPIDLLALLHSYVSIVEDFNLKLLQAYFEHLHITKIYKSHK